MYRSYKNMDPPSKVQQVPHFNIVHPEDEIITNLPVSQVVTNEAFIQDSLKAAHMKNTSALSKALDALT